MTSILVVEDDTAIREAVRRGLTERGYAVATAATGMSGLEHVLAEQGEALGLFHDFQPGSAIDLHAGPFPGSRPVPAGPGTAGDHRFFPMSNHRQGHRSHRVG